MRRMRHWTVYLLSLIILVMCGTAYVSAQESVGETQIDEAVEGPEIQGLTYEGAMVLDYAQSFDVYFYQDGYRMIDINQGTQYLVVPEGKEAPEGLDENITVLQMPLNHVYLAATAAMALYDSVGGLDCIRLVGTDASGWYIENAVAAIEAGDILFAGKYSEPDFELLIDEECDLAIESTMIFHTPKIKEMLEDLDIPVLVDYATYESHPLGRAEWLKLYGVLTGREEEAASCFQKQKDLVSDLDDFPNTEQTVAFFYISSDGKAVVRASNDYVAHMIELAGGRYVFDGLTNEESSLSTVNMTMEDFYSMAVDADYLIYNATIDNPIGSIQDLLAKSSLFADFKAVKNGNVWCAGKEMYQSTDRMGNAILDFYHILTDGDESQMTFMTKVNESEG